MVFETPKSSEPLSYVNSPTEQTSSTDRLDAFFQLPTYVYECLMSRVHILKRRNPILGVNLLASTRSS